MQERACNATLEALLLLETCRNKHPFLTAVHVTHLGMSQAFQAVPVANAITVHQACTTRLQQCMLHNVCSAAACKPCTQAGISLHL